MATFYNPELELRVFAALHLDRAVLRANLEGTEDRMVESLTDKGVKTL